METWTGLKRQDLNVAESSRRAVFGLRVDQGRGGNLIGYYSWPCFGQLKVEKEKSERSDSKTWLTVVDGSRILIRQKSEWRAAGAPLSHCDEVMDRFTATGWRSQVWEERGHEFFNTFPPRCPKKKWNFSALRFFICFLFTYSTGGGTISIQIQLKNPNV